MEYRGLDLQGHDTPEKTYTLTYKVRTDYLGEWRTEVVTGRSDATHVSDIVGDLITQKKEEELNGLLKTVETMNGRGQRNVFDPLVMLSEKEYFNMRAAENAMRKVEELTASPINSLGSLTYDLEKIIEDYKAGETSEKSYLVTIGDRVYYKNNDYSKTYQWYKYQKDMFKEAGLDVGFSEVLDSQKNK